MDELSNCLAAFDVVVHLAGAAGWCLLQQGIDMNVGGTCNLLGACHKAGTTKFIVASSVTVTGTTSPDHPPKALPITNQHGFVGRKWAYSLSKQMAEDMVHFISTCNGEEEYLLVRIGGIVSDPSASYI
jgi:nucleoside-diphosphate-sugar epimerase